MITHVVMFKLKKRTPEEINKVVDMLRALDGKVPSLKGIEAGADVLKTERSCDIALVARFESLAALDEYQRHPEHVKVAQYIAGVRESVVAVDYESI